MMDRAERELLERSIRAALERHTGAALDEALHGLGWHDAARTEPRTAIATLFELHGQLNVASSLDPVLASVLDPDGPARTVVLPAFGSRDAPAERRGGTVVVRGVGGRRMAGADEVLVAVGTGSGTEIACVPTAGLDLRPVRGLDPALGLVAVEGVVAHGVERVGERPGEHPGQRAAGTVARSVGRPSDTWAEALARARLAVSHELVGASRAMLALAREHAVERIQFGQPISSFQAVRHRLADGLVAVEAAGAAADTAWEEGSAFSASVAKALAGRSARVVARHAQQVLAGMGFTAEHPLHRFVRRAVALDQLLGSSDSLTRSVGAELLRTGALPAALPL